MGVGDFTIDVDLSIKDGDGGKSGISGEVKFFSPFSHADTVGFIFLKADVAN